MSDTTRALAYIQIFIGLGNDWRYCAPLDCVSEGDDAIRIGSVLLRRVGERVWSLDDGDAVRLYGSAHWGEVSA